MLKLLFILLPLLISVDSFAQWRRHSTPPQKSYYESCVCLPDSSFDEHILATHNGIMDDLGGYGNSVSCARAIVAEVLCPQYDSRASAKPAPEPRHSNASAKKSYYDSCSCIPDSSFDEHILGTHDGIPDDLGGYGNSVSCARAIVAEILCPQYDPRSKVVVSKPAPEPEPDYTPAPTPIPTSNSNVQPDGTCSVNGKCDGIAPGDECTSSMGRTGVCTTVCSCHEL